MTPAIEDESVILPIAGGCFCGSVRYQLTQEPTSVGVCHCESCRRIAGAESVAWAAVDSSEFTFLEDQPQVFASSEGVERTFCGNCGSTLTYRRQGDCFIDVTLASLDNSEVLTPTMETWCEERVSWNPLNSNLKHHPRGSSS